MGSKRAFVRYAKNKIVAGSLILADKAPKVGVWREIPADLCCIPPIDNRVAYLSGTGDCCPGGSGKCGEVTIYLLQSCIDNPQIGCQVWADLAGTTPVANNNYFINSLAGPLYITTLIGAKGGTESFVTALIPCV